MKEGLGYRTKNSEAKRNYDLGMRINQGILSQQYVVSPTSPSSLEASYASAMFDFENYLRTLSNFANSYLSLGNSYSANQPNKEQSYELDLLDNRETFTMRCPNCGEKLKNFRKCERCGWTPFEEDVKKGFVYE
jgi:hypothetical protein